MSNEQEIGKIDLEEIRMTIMGLELRVDELEAAVDALSSGERRPKSRRVAPKQWGPEAKRRAQARVDGRNEAIRKAVEKAVATAENGGEVRVVAIAHATGFSLTKCAHVMTEMAKRSDLIQTVGHGRRTRYHKAT